MTLMSCRCACDIPAHTYTYTFQPKHDWTSHFASSTEIQQYLVEFAQKHSLHEKIRFQHHVQGASWEDDNAQWRIDVTDNSISPNNDYQLVCDILINAGGYLNSWKWPKVKNLEYFKGDLTHSAEYDTSINLKGKRVGVIGNGWVALEVLLTVRSVLIISLQSFCNSNNTFNCSRGSAANLLHPITNLCLEQRKCFIHRLGNRSLPAGFHPSSRLSQSTWAGIQFHFQ